MRKKIVVIWLSVAMLFSSVVIVIEIFPVVKANNRIYVDDIIGEGPSNPTENFTSIQEAINNANNGDTIFVYNGTYFENIVINKTINLTGESKESTKIQGAGIGDVVNISADWVNITDFSVSGSGSNSEDAGIELYNVQNVGVVNNKIFNNYNGIALRDCSGNNIISNIASMNDYGGIYLTYCSGNNIVGNNASNNDYHGINLYYSNNNNINDNTASFMTNFHAITLLYSNINTISFNTVFSNDADGITLIWSDGNTVTDNIIFSNRWYGIFLYDDSDDNIITGNTASDNEHGINIFEFSDNNIITYNTISNNDYGIEIMDWESSNNRIYHNIIIDNTMQAVDRSTVYNQWDNGYPSGGNYWSDYTGTDGNGDGIGDTPYPIGLNQDNYPLMNAVGNYIHLYQGWNLISIPRHQSDINLGVVLKSIKGSYDAVQWYNVSDTSDPWKHNHTKKPSHLNDLIRIDNTISFWVHITEPGGVLFQYPGTQPIENQTINISLGWNLVGYPSLTNNNRTVGLNNLIFGPDVEAIWTYNADTQTWKEITASDNFEVGRGYWMHSKVTKTWIVPL